MDFFLSKIIPALACSCELISAAGRCRMDFLDFGPFGLLWLLSLSSSSESSRPTGGLWKANKLFRVAPVFLAASEVLLLLSGVGGLFARSLSRSLSLSLLFSAFSLGLSLNAATRAPALI